jgi:hypothetical protein
VNGNWTGIRWVRYTFNAATTTQYPRVGEVIATVPEPGSLGLVAVVVLAGAWVARRRRAAGHPG